MALVPIHRATHRAALAGVGTTGSLVAAVIAVASVTAGVVGFTAWPDAPSRQPTSAVEMQRKAVAARHAVTGGSIALPAARGSQAAGVSSGATTRVGPSAGAIVVPGGRAAFGRAQSVAVPASSVTPASEHPVAQRPGGERVDSALAPVAQVTSIAGDQLAVGVKSGGDAAGQATRTLSPLIANTVADVSAVTAAGVAKAGAALSDVLSALGSGGGGPR